MLGFFKYFPACLALINRNMRLFNKFACPKCSQTPHHHFKKIIFEKSVQKYQSFLTNHFLATSRSLFSQQSFLKVWCSGSACPHFLFPPDNSPHIKQCPKKCICMHLYVQSSKRNPPASALKTESGP